MDDVIQEREEEEEEKNGKEESEEEEWDKLRHTSDWVEGNRNRNSREREEEESSIEIDKIEGFLLSAFLEHIASYLLKLICLALLYVQ